MPMIDDLLGNLPEGRIRTARIGLHWTAVVAETAGETLCGLASTLPSPHDHPGGTDLPEAGRLNGMDAREVAGWLRAPSPPAVTRPRPQRAPDPARRSCRGRA